MEKLWKSFFHYSDVRGMDYPGPVITFPSAKSFSFTERAATLPCGTKLCPLPPHRVIVLLPPSCRQVLPQAPLGSDTWESALGKVILGGNTGQALSVTARRADLSPWHRGRLWLCHTTPVPSCHPSQGTGARGVLWQLSCPARADVLWF